MLPKISVVISTYTSSGKFLDSCIQAILQQDYPNDKIEIIVADNLSTDDTIAIAERYRAKIISVDGQPSQAARQRNLGVAAATGEYVYILDHDMLMTPGLFSLFAIRVNETKGEVDAWYIPEKIVGNDKFWNKVRTFERSFYNGTVVDAVRIIKREVFTTGLEYDTKLSDGPADWDFDIIFKKSSRCLAILDGPEYVNHYEHFLTLRKYLSKKVGYFVGGEKYQKKWLNLDKNIYNDIIKKQYSPFYRLVMVFIENKKWKKIISHPVLFLLVFRVRLLVAVVYLFRKIYV